MCELFAMSSKYPTNVTLSLEELARHGGQTGPHADGWGIAYYEDFDARVLREPAPAYCSSLMKHLKHQGVQSHRVISHIRKATTGALKLSNTHPFQRELGGRVHIFAHNGELGAISESEHFELGCYHPIGDTDSEYAFCALMQRLRDIWKKTEAPTFSKRLAVITKFAEQLRPLGPANFIYSDGEYLFAHGHKRTQLDGKKKPPGLYVLNRACRLQKDIPNLVGVKVKDSQKQIVTLFASVPLSDEGWEPLEEGEIVVAHLGKIIVGCSANADSIDI